MLDILSMIFWAMLLIVILVGVHEFGHFWVARKLGVKVLRFSIGFGAPLWKHKAKDGVEYILAAIPLGGYVKMVDEREEELLYDLDRGRVRREPGVDRRHVLAQRYPQIGGAVPGCGT